MVTYYTDVSVDLETLGTKPGSIITQIGLCLFNANEGWNRPGNSAPMSRQIYVEPESCAALGMTMDWSTIAWWMRQGEDARNSLIQPLDPLPLYDALAKLRSTLSLHCVSDYRIWGYGANFDVVLLEDAYRRVNRTPPWVYQQIYCGRTLVRQYPGYTRVPPTVAHLAESDAIAQANWIADCWRQTIIAPLVSEKPVTVEPPAFKAMGGRPF